MADIIRLSGVPFQAALLPDFLSLPLHNLRQLFRKAIAVRIEEQTAAEILIFGDIITDFSDQDRLPCAVFKDGGFPPACGQIRLRFPLPIPPANRTHYYNEDKTLPD